MNETIRNKQLSVAVDGRIFTTNKFKSSGLKKYFFQTIKNIATNFPSIHLTVYFELGTKLEELRLFFSDTPIAVKHYPTNKLSHNDADVFLSIYSTNFECCYDTPFRYVSDIPTIVFVAKILELTNPYIFNNFSEAFITNLTNKLESLQSTSTHLISLNNTIAEKLTGIISNNVSSYSFSNNTFFNSHIVSDAEIKTTLDNYKINTPYFLMVCNNDFYKNLNLPISAFIKFKANFPNQDYKLVITGSLSDPFRKSLKEYINKQTCFFDIILTDYITERELECLYRSTLALIHPVWYDTNGFAIKEAISLDCPVITSHTKTTEEITKGNAIFIDCNNEDEYISAMQRVSRDSYCIRTRNNNSLDDTKIQTKTHELEKLVDLINNISNKTKPTTNTIQENNNTLIKKQLRNIIVDARCLITACTVSRGIGIYASNLLKTIANKYLGLTLTLMFEKNSDIKEIQTFFSGNQNVKFSFYQHSKTEYDGDLFFILDPITSTSFFELPYRYVTNLPYCAIVYDLIAIIQREKHFDRWDINSQNSYNTRLEMLKQTDTHILSISECTKNDLINQLEISPHRITTIMAGLNRSEPTDKHSPEEQNRLITELKRRYLIQDPYFLTIGALDSHKMFNFTFSSILYYQEQCRIKNRQAPQLVIVGSKKDPHKEIYKKIITENDLPNFIFTDYISREELDCLYQNAAGLLYPSTYEGFGFPILEAMANGCPVITSKTSAIPEVAGECALYVKQDNIHDYCNCLERLLFDTALREQLIKDGKKRAESFSWEKVAETTVKAWEAIFLQKQQIKNIS